MVISDDVRGEALRAFTAAYHCQRAGEIERAIFHYTRSIELIPTAEAHTFLGWAYSFQGRLEEAIEECLKAVELDPSLGNSYNDIGAYLIELGRPEDALNWLARALRASRYENYSYPFYNLGRAHELLGQIEVAGRRYQKSIDEDPAFTPALLALRRIGYFPTDHPED